MGLYCQVLVYGYDYSNSNEHCCDTVAFISFLDSFCTITNHITAPTHGGQAISTPHEKHCEDNCGDDNHKLNHLIFLFYLIRIEFQMEFDSNLGLVHGHGGGDKKED